MRKTVITQLETLGVRGGESEYEQDDLLRPALIRNLDNLPAYAAETRRKYWNEIEALERRNDRGFTDLDLFTDELVIVAAAGNRGFLQNPPPAVWPAAMTEVVAVGATDASFSMKRNRVDVTADGIDVPGLSLEGEVRLTRALQNLVHDGRAPAYRPA